MGNLTSPVNYQASSFKERLSKFIKEDGLTVLIVLILVTSYAILRTSGDTFDSIQAFQQSFDGTNPTVIEFYSNNCSICLTSKPKVMQLERNLDQTARVLKLDVKDPINQILANQWGVLGVPTFFVLDSSGEIVYSRSGAPDIEAITSTVITAIESE
jgi:thiol-disulfide isomerase/thioredoxin